jgi:FkbM family methyltransferase
MEIDYTQYGEQEKITEFFNGATGVFLDVGAANGITYSNTYNLLLSNWSGVSIEPEAQAFHELTNNYKQFGDRSIKVNAVISPVEGFVKFYAHGQLSTTSVDHMKKWESHAIKYNGTWEPSFYYSITLGQIIEYFKLAYDFISIDIEGQNFELVKSFDWNLVPDCKLVCIEHDGQQDLILSHLKPYGFNQYFDNPVNLLLSR